MMSVKVADQIKDLPLRRFTTKLNKDIVPCLNSNADEVATLSMAMTALYLYSVGGMPLEDANTFVVDGPNDFGIDGIWFDPRTHRLHITQSKFRTNQSKSVSQAEVIKFCNGVERILQLDFAGANDKLRVLLSSVESALDEINTKIHIGIVTSSLAELAPNCVQIIEKLCAKFNKVDEILTYNYVKFDEVYRIARTFSPGSNVDIDIEVSSIGRITDPYTSYFGLVAGEDVASWVDEFGSAVYAPNVRFTLPSSAVNDQILETIEKEPTHFWFYNNGITAIASEAKSKMLGGSSSKVYCQSFGIVNGAQTVGTIARAKEDGLDLSRVRVPFRVISLVGTEPGFDESVTRANNTQNELTALDFVSLDPRQELLQNELATYGHQYIVKRGSPVEADKKPLEVRELAIALACAHGSLPIAVQAKRYVSGLWNDIKREPYTALFNDDLSTSYADQCVRIGREVDLSIKEYKAKIDQTNNLILTHGDKFILHFVFSKMQSERGNIKLTYLGKSIQVDDLISRLLSAYKELDPGYPSTVFKNVALQEALKSKMEAPT